MTMTNEEIVRHYRQAKDPDADIQVLADLNSTSRDAIWAVLNAAGVTLTTKRKAAKPRQNFGDSIAPLYAQGLTDTEIALRVGCTASCVAGWRRRSGLQRNQADAKAENKPPAPAEEVPAVCDMAYDRVEAILAAVPSGMDAEIRRKAGRLCLAMLGDYIAHRLDLLPADLNN